MRFTIQPPPGESAFEQWKDAMKGVARLPLGIPPEFRKKVWLSLANHYIKDLKIDWEKTVRFAFNERSNPDDDKLGLQIVKDLHRTGCSSYSGQDNEQDRAVLKRVLLAYARWNKRVGYCQGFNVIAALLLEVMDRKEDDALMVMIYLVDHVLPESYFANNLRALSVDMAVFRDLLRMTLPKLAKHLNHLQNAASDMTTGACYEPPLTNVFTMQWFLTLFATCLPKAIVLRVWDSILLEGSDVLLRTALTIWGKLARRIKSVASADEFYTLMGDLSADMIQGHIFNADDFIKSVYSVAPFPFPQLTELREKYTYNIRPFTSSGSSSSKKGSSRISKTLLYSDEDDLDDEDIEAITCFPGLVPMPGGKGRGEGDTGSGLMADISVLGPGAYSLHPDAVGGGPVYMERMSTDISSLQKQYEKLRLRQRQAHIIIAAASTRQTAKPKATALVPKIESPLAMNHLFIGKHAGGKNRLVAEGPRIVSVFKHSNKYPQLGGKRRQRKDSNTSVRSDRTCSSLKIAEEGSVSRDQEESEGEMPLSSPEIINHENSSEASPISTATGPEYLSDPDTTREDSVQDENSVDTEEPWKDETSLEKCIIEKGSDSSERAESSDDEGVVADVNTEKADANITTTETVSVGTSPIQDDSSSDEDELVWTPLNTSSPQKCSPKHPEPQCESVQSDFSTDARFQGSVVNYSRDKENMRHQDRGPKPKPDLRIKFPTNPSTSESDCGPSPNQMTTEMMTKFVYIASRQHNNKTKSSRSSSSSQSTTPTTPDTNLTFKPSSPTKSFKPFPMKQLNSNRAKNGLKLGLYTSSTLQQFESQGRKAQGSFFKVKNSS